MFIFFIDWYIRFMSIEIKQLTILLSSSLSIISIIFIISNMLRKKTKSIVFSYLSQFRAVSKLKQKSTLITSAASSFFLFLFVFSMALHKIVPWNLPFFVFEKENVFKLRPFYRFRHFYFNFSFLLFYWCVEPMVKKKKNIKITQNHKKFVQFKCLNTCYPIASIPRMIF